MIEQLIIIGTILLVVSVPAIYWIRFKRKSDEISDLMTANKEAGLTEPVSLHPKISLNNCISTGACITACPEQNVLGIINGVVHLVSPTKCIGHGACMQACPTDAISLVFGTEKRGVDIPHVTETFETNIDGVYIVGELGGMGLIRNAVTQGRQAVEHIKKTNDDCYDVIIIGAGPAGLAATLQAKKSGLSHLTLEQENDIGGTILTYPRQKLVMTQPMEIPLYGKYKNREISKEELTELWSEIISKNDINVHCSEKVDSIERLNEKFQVNTTKSSYMASQVVIAIGRRGTPRKLDVPGEHSTKVAYKLLEPEQYAHKNLLVVGGGDSAVEAAVSLSLQPGTTVWLSYRKEVFGRIKDDNRTRLNNAVAENRVTLLLESEVYEIDKKKVTLNGKDGAINIPNDFVFVFIGGELPTSFLEKIGIKMERKFGVS